MYKKVLVPLDGSKLAECALKEVRLLAQKGCIGEVVVLTAVDYPAALLGEGSELRTETHRYHELQKGRIAQAKEYLDGIRTQLAGEGVAVRTEVLEGRADQIIVEYAAKNAVDLLVIASHGITGIRKWVFGSTALRVLHDSRIPVLLIRPESCRS